MHTDPCAAAAAAAAATTAAPAILVSSTLSDNIWEEVLHFLANDWHSMGLLASCDRTCTVSSRRTWESYEYPKNLKL